MCGGFQRRDFALTDHGDVAEAVQDDQASLAPVLIVSSE